ncbi:MAG: hypothetical protein Q9181_003934 [Wetmoreana brouardii]
MLESTEDLDADDRGRKLMRHLESKAEGSFDRKSLVLVQELVVSRAARSFQSSKEFLEALAQGINCICDALLQPQPFDITVLSLQAINIILHKQPRVVTQWHIDQIMGVIATLASRSPPSITYTTKQTALRYLALCRIFNTMLSFHRKRLGGRYHLILPVLQSLLRPLFIPFTILPSNQPSSPATENPFTATHASAYARILLQLADPTLSSLTSHSHSTKSRQTQNLNDPTKIAKSIAGQHLHYLIMTYCDCQLRGRLKPEVRQKLKPGIWAVLDVIPQETMRVMNAGMDKAGRAIWRALYGEWRRDGRGRGR